MQCDHDAKKHHYTATIGGEVHEGTVRAFTLEERDMLFREASLVPVVAHGTAEDTGCSWKFDPPIDIKPGMTITVKESA